MTLLPNNATSLERAAEAAAGASDNADAIRPLYRPRDIPEPILSWLSWAFDVPIWPDGEQARRNITADAWKLHRKRGTLGGMRAIAKYAGSEVVRAITPPAKLFLSPSLTREERNAFVARHPQLRIYRYRTIGQRIGLFFGDHFGAGHYAQNDAALRAAPRAFLYRDGVETELTIIERVTETQSRTAQTTTITEVGIPGQAGFLSFAGGHPRFFGVTDAPRRVYRMTIGTPYMDSTETLHKSTLSPGLDPINVNPDSVAEPGVARGLYFGGHIAGHFVESDARDRLYQRIYLFDPAIEAPRRIAFSHFGHGVFGMPPHHAEIAVRIPGRRHPRAVSQFATGFFVERDRSRYDATLAALRNMSRLSDRITIDTAIMRPITVSDTLTAGDNILAGSWIDS